MNSLLDLKPTETVLFLAEGNFTFSSSLVQYWIKGCPFKLSKIVSTSYEPEPVSKIAEDNVENLKKFGVQVLFSVDARKWFAFHSFAIFINIKKIVCLTKTYYLFIFLC